MTWRILGGKVQQEKFATTVLEEKARELVQRYCMNSLKIQHGEQILNNLICETRNGSNGIVVIDFLVLKSCCTARNWA